MTTGKRYDFLLKQIKDRDASADGQSRPARSCGLLAKKGVF